MVKRVMMVVKRVMKGAGGEEDVVLPEIRPSW